MVSVVSPSAVARNRYQRCFASNIFDPPDPTKAHAAPAGKRRDQTVNELFGDAQEGKNLKFQQGTFEPRGDERSARHKKQEFLSSTVLPSSEYMDGQGAQAPDDERNFSADPVERRLQENTSLIFNVDSGGVDPDCHARWAENKLRPTSFRWYQYPTPVGEEDGSAEVRALHEKRSTVFREDAEDQSEEAAVAARHKEEAEDRKVEKEMEEKRRANCYYSDLFGRETPGDFAKQGGEHHPKHKSSAEDRITVHGDWSDSRTELERGAVGPNSKTPADRKLREFHHANVFDQYEDPGVGFHLDPIKIHCQAPDVMDNSRKVVRHDADTKVIHQAHMKSSVVEPEFYAEAASRTAWEVAEVHVSGLAADENNESISKKVKHAGFHVIRVNANMDPVNNTCKGNCRLQVRYNPDAQQHPITTLIKILEDRYGLRGEI